MHRPLASKRSLRCLATVVRIASEPNGDRCLAAEFNDLRFRDLPLEFCVDRDKAPNNQQCGVDMRDGTKYSTRGKGPTWRFCAARFKSGNGAES
jgi:hypothetical protein